jgi:hypothetical protein
LFTIVVPHVAGRYDGRVVMTSAHFNQSGHVINLDGIRDWDGQIWTGIRDGRGDVVKGTDGQCFWPHTSREQPNTLLSAWGAESRRRLYHLPSGGRKPPQKSASWHQCEAMPCRVGPSTGSRSHGSGRPGALVTQHCRGGHRWRRWGRSGDGGSACQGYGVVGADWEGWLRFERKSRMGDTEIDGNNMIFA